jgi:hypothetical protein
MSGHDDRELDAIRCRLESIADDPVPDGDAAWERLSARLPDRGPTVAPVTAIPAGMGGSRRLVRRVLAVAAAVVLIGGTALAAAPDTVMTGLRDFFSGTAPQQGPRGPGGSGDGDRLVGTPHRSGGPDEGADPNAEGDEDDDANEATVGQHQPADDGDDDADEVDNSGPGNGDDAEEDGDDHDGDDHDGDGNDDGDDDEDAGDQDDDDRGGSGGDDPDDDGGHSGSGGSDDASAGSV